MNVGIVVGYAKRFFDNLGMNKTASKALTDANRSSTINKWRTIGSGNFTCDFK